MTQMTHRERVMAALSHQEPDMVPLDLGSTIDSSIVSEAYQSLMAHLGVEEEIVLTNRMMRSVGVSERVLQALDIDTRGVFPGAPADVMLEGDRYRDQWGVERVRPAGSYYYDQVRFPLSGPISARDILSYPWPDPYDPIRTKGLQDRVREVREQGDCAAVLNLPSAFVHASQYLRGFEDWYMDIAADTKLAGILYDAVLDVNLAICQQILSAVGNDVDIVMTADDLGLQNGLMMSPEVYRQLVKPRHRRYFQLIHSLSPAKLLFHTCGSVVDIIEDLVEIGVDVLNPIQVTAKGMTPQALKHKYGDRLAFWGAMDTQQVLPHGSIANVQREVERRIEELGCGGGYVLGAVHNIQPDVPPENVLAMYRYAREYVPSYAR